MNILVYSGHIFHPYSLLLYVIVCVVYVKGLSRVPTVLICQVPNQTRRQLSLKHPHVHKIQSTISFMM